MTNIIEKIFSVNGVLKKEKPLGDIPNTSEVYNEVLKVATPAVADTVLVAIISMVDTIMVSSMGSAAVAGVGLTTQPRMILLATFMAISTGVTAVVARRRGEGNQEGASKALEQSMTIGLIGSVIFSLLGFVFAQRLMYFAGAQADSVGYATTYFKILMLGIPFNVLTVFINGAQRGCGNTKISMKINLTANVINLVLNYLLINGHMGFPRLGVAGAAIATITGNIVGFFMAIYSLSSKREQFLNINIKAMFKIKREVLSPVLVVGLSAGFEQIFLRLGFFLYAKIIAQLGTEAMATHNICNSILNLSFAFCDGLAMTASAFFGQNLGKKRPDLSMLYTKACRKISIVMVALVDAVLIFGGKYIMLVFTDVPSIIETGRILLLIIAITSPIQALQFITSSSLRVGGDAKYTAYVSMISVGILRPILAYLFCYTFSLGIVGAWSSYFVDQVIRFTLYHIRFMSGKWKNIKL